MRTQSLIQWTTLAGGLAGNHCSSQHCRCPATKKYTLCHFILRHDAPDLETPWALNDQPVAQLASLSQGSSDLPRPINDWLLQRTEGPWQYDEKMKWRTAIKVMLSQTNCCRDTVQPRKCQLTGIDCSTAAQASGSPEPALTDYWAHSMQLGEKWKLTLFHSLSRNEKNVSVIRYWFLPAQRHA